MTYTVELSDTAKKSLRNIAAYISQDKPLAAEKFVQKLLDACFSLDEFPLRNPRTPGGRKYGPKSEIRHMIHRPYRMIYSVVGKRVTILDILHGARQDHK